MAEYRLQDTKRIVLHLLILYSVLSVFLFTAIRLYRLRNFSTEKLEEMMTKTSTQRDRTDDPCKYSIVGEPVNAKLEYIKISVYCSRTSKSLNTMDIRAIKDRTAGGAISELGRINGYDVTISKEKVVIGKRSDLKNDQWICLQNRKVIHDFSESLSPKGNIDCFNGLDSKGIENFYASL